MHLHAHFHRLTARAQMILMLVLLTLSAVFIVLHGVRVRQMKEVGLPAALALPQIEKRLDVLKEQAEVMQLQQSVSDGSNSEQLHVYVLPDEPRLDRLLATFDALFEALRQGTSLTTVSAVHVGDTVAASRDASLTMTPVSFEADVNEEGLHSLFLFTDVSGLLTVGDAFTPEEQSLLLSLTEQENPAAVTALESFLSQTLLTYAQDPKHSEEQLLKSFTSDSFTEALHTIARESRLREVTRLFSGNFLSVIEARKLWPLRFLTVAKADIEDRGNNQFHIAVTFTAYGRQAKH